MQSWLNIKPELFKILPNEFRVYASVLVSNLYATPQTKVWQKTYGGSENDEAHAITPTKDGGFIVAGYTGSFRNADVYLIKIDKKGESFKLK